MIARLGLQAFRTGSTALAIATLMILCPFAGLAQIAPGIAPLEIIVSFLPQILLVSAIAACGLAIQNWRLGLLALPILFLTGLPFITFSKFESGAGGPCAGGECLTIISANIYSIPAAMPKLNALAERERADIVAINEAARMTVEEYHDVFPDYAHVIHAAWENMPKHMGNPITLLSRIPYEGSDRILRTDTGRRAFIVADLSGPWGDLRVVALHAMTPLSQPSLKARNVLLNAAEAYVENTPTFIFLGDFNLTPWSPYFRRLPGQRAGDPRRSNTWPTFAPLLGLSIDHIMFDGQLELVEFKVLESVGSDHYPVLARFRRPAQP